MTGKKVSPDTHLQIANAIKFWDPAFEVPESMACDIEILPGDAPIVDEDTTELPVEPAPPATKKKRGGQACSQNRASMERIPKRPGHEFEKLGFKVSISVSRASVPSALSIASARAMPCQKSTIYGGPMLASRCPGLQSSRQGVTASALTSGTESSSSTPEAHWSHQSGALALDQKMALAFFDSPNLGTQRRLKKT